MTPIAHTPAQTIALLRRSAEQAGQMVAHRDWVAAHLAGCADERAARSRGLRPDFIAAVRAEARALGIAEAR
jgi:hypothetical protein